MEAHSAGHGLPRREKLWQGLGLAQSLGRAIWGQGTTAKKRTEREGEIEPRARGHVRGHGGERQKQRGKRGRKALGEEGEAGERRRKIADRKESCA